MEVIGYNCKFVLDLKLFANYKKSNDINIRRSRLRWGWLRKVDLPYIFHHQSKQNKFQILVDCLQNIYISIIDFLEGGPTWR